MTPVLHAISSAVLWAISALIVTRGLACLPEARLSALILGLTVALVSGTLLLLLFFGASLQGSDVSPSIIVAGILTFPIATGIYYIASDAFGGRAELAAQFSQVKPLASVLLAWFLLSEPLDISSGIAFIFIAIGVAMMIAARRQGHITSLSVVLGLILALMWAAGEVAIAYGAVQGRGVQQTTVALLAGTVAGVALAIPSLTVLGWPPIGKWIIFFALHGVISFGLAYAFYFEAIRNIGVGPTALINAFWPMLSLIASWVIYRGTALSPTLPKLIWIAAVFLMVGSLASIFATF